MNVKKGEEKKEPRKGRRHRLLPLLPLSPRESRAGQEDTGRERKIMGNKNHGIHGREAFHNFLPPSLGAGV